MAISVVDGHNSLVSQTKAPLGKPIDPGPAHCGPVIDFHLAGRGGVGGIGPIRVVLVSGVGYGGSERNETG